MPTKTLKVLDPAVKRGAGLRPEDRTQLVADCELIINRVEDDLLTLRRLPGQVFDIKSSQTLVDRGVEVIVATDNLLTSTAAARKALQVAVNKFKRALAAELNRSPDDLD